MFLPENRKLCTTSPTELSSINLTTKTLYESASALAFNTENGSLTPFTLPTTVNNLDTMPPAETAIYRKESLVSPHGHIVSNQVLTNTHVSVANHILSQCRPSAGKMSVFIEIIEEQVRHYVVNHESKMILWAFEQVPESFKDATRRKHEHEYWIHMKNFPEEFPTSDSLSQANSSGGISDGATLGITPGQPEQRYVDRTRHAAAHKDHSAHAVHTEHGVALSSIMVGCQQTQVIQFILIGISLLVPHGILDSTKQPQIRQEPIHIAECENECQPCLIEANIRMETPARLSSLPLVADDVPSEPIDAILEYLQNTGFKNLTGSINLSKSDEFPFRVGHSGEIYTGILGTNIPIAIKGLKLKNNLTDHQRSRLWEYTIHESLVWSKCNHLNVHEFLGVAQYRNRFVMISPWMKRGDLRRLISRGLYPQIRLPSMCAQICAGVAHLHELGIAHGDLKSENILVSEDFTVKITDFGNAVFEGVSSEPLVYDREPQFSLRWAPREMLVEKPKPSARADIHSLGMTLLEVTTGSEPYAGIRDHLVQENIVNGVLPERPDKPTQTWDDFLWPLFARCWAFDPCARPNAVTIREEIRQFLTQRQHSN